MEPGISTECQTPVKGRQSAVKGREHVGKTGKGKPFGKAFNEKGGKISDASVVLGHVAPTPWVASKAASALNGKSLNDATKKAAGEAAADGATPLSDNGYKVQQVKVAVRRAIDAAS